MTPDIEALVARLERDSDTDDVFSKAAYALRRQAREIERLKGLDDAFTRLMLCHDMRDALQARVRELEGYMEERAHYLRENGALRAENGGLRKDAERYRWLRDTSDVDAEKAVLRDGENFDAYIDAALAGSPDITAAVIDSPQAPLK